MEQATLCLLVKEGRDGRELLLAMKKRGFGVGKWNGIGGKFDQEKGDKNLVGTAIREIEEEIGVKAKELEKVAVLSFYFPYIPKNDQEEWDQDVHVFLVKSWEGEPAESEEMSPRWFRIGEIPFAKMWNDDEFWLPLVLEGKKLKADFVFQKGEIILKHTIKIVENLSENKI